MLADMIIDTIIDVALAGVLLTVAGLGCWWAWRAWRKRGRRYRL